LNLEKEPFSMTIMDVVMAANEVNGFAFFALVDMMGPGKLFPVGLLVGKQYPCSPAQRAHTIESCENGCSNEFGPVGNTVHGLFQRFGNLKSNNFFAIRHISLFLGL
jgi:hypothetical protein